MLGDVPAKIAHAETLKEQGNTAFKAGDLQPALRNYHHALLHVRGLDDTSADGMGGGAGGPGLPAAMKDKIHGLEVSIYSNMAAIHVKKGEWDKAVAKATKGLQINKDHPKLLYRRGLSWINLKNKEKAEADLKEALRFAPGDGNIKAAMGDLRALAAAEDKMAAPTYQKMFR